MDVGEPEWEAADAVAGKESKESWGMNGVGVEIIVPVKLGRKGFHSSLEMVQYFYNLLHAWVSNVVGELVAAVDMFVSSSYTSPSLGEIVRF